MIKYLVLATFLTSMVGSVKALECPQVSQKGIEFIQKWEGLRLSAYADVGGVWTIGYGHTKTAYKGLEIDQNRASELLRADLRDFEEVVCRGVAVELKQREFDALVSFAFNIGPHAFLNSTFLKRFNEGQIRAAAHEVMRWIHVNKKPIKGLYKRRKAEIRLFKGDL